MMVFASRFWIREYRRCRQCSERIVVFLLNGASCPRDPYFTCAECRGETDDSAAVSAALEREHRSQLRLVEGVDG